MVCRIRARAPADGYDRAPQAALPGGQLALGDPARAQCNVVEVSERYGKSELVIDTPCARTWERCLKLPLLAAMAHAFLRSLQRREHTGACRWLSRYWRHGTAKRSREVATPLYHLRFAPSRLWFAYLPSNRLTQRWGLLMSTQ